MRLRAVIPAIALAVVVLPACASTGGTARSQPPHATMTGGADETRNARGEHSAGVSRLVGSPDHGKSAYSPTTVPASSSPPVTLHSIG